MTTPAVVNAEPRREVTRLAPMRHLQPVARLAVGILSVVVLLAACSGPAASVAPSPSAAPLNSDAPVVSGPPASGDPIPGGSTGGGDLPADGAKVVVPRPGQLDVRPRPADRLAATVDGRDVTVSVDWWSGVEPCTILDSIVVAKGDHSFAITLREGHSAELVMCVDIAELHRAFIDLGELEPGTYTFSDAMGGAPAIEVGVA